MEAEVYSIPTGLLQGAKFVQDRVFCFAVMLWDGPLVNLYSILAKNAESLINWVFFKVSHCMTSFWHKEVRNMSVLSNKYFWCLWKGKFRSKKYEKKIF